MEELHSKPLFLHYRTVIMKFFTTDIIRRADAYTIANEPVASIDLMERAANRLKEWIINRYQPSDSFKIFAGPGNNGGDAWALARLLWTAGFPDISVYLLDNGRKLSPDSEINQKRLKEIAPEIIHSITSKSSFPEIRENDVVIDGLFGSGLTRPLEGLAVDLVHHLNNSDSKSIIAIDIPSGLFGEDNQSNIHENIIKADFTLTIQFPKLSFFFPENEEFVGEWVVLPIGIHPEFIQNQQTQYHFISSEDISSLLRKRKKFSHKGTYGHALFIAGSYGMMGASVMGARAVVRGGTGLLTTHVPRSGVEIVQTSVPESLISIDDSDVIFTEVDKLDSYTAIAIGPGLNQKSNSKKGLLKLLEEVKVPLIIDADGLNMLATVENWQDHLPENTILTPHPKEYQRLFGSNSGSYERLEQQLSFSRKHNCVIVLKGAHTCITSPDGTAWFNTSGNPGMAKGGSGDVLTGLLLALTAQGYSPTKASLIAVYIHGLAGDLAAKEMGEYGMIPSDIIHNIGKAFLVIEKTIGL